MKVDAFRAKKFVKYSEKVKLFSHAPRTRWMSYNVRISCNVFSSVRIPSVEEGEMTCELPWAHVELLEARTRRCSRTLYPHRKKAKNTQPEQIPRYVAISPCAAPHVGQNSTGDTEVDVLLANQLGREAILRVEEDKRQDKRQDKR